MNQKKRMSLLRFSRLRANEIKDFLDCSIRTQAASQMRVSLLKFEPRVSNFPALEASWLLVSILQLRSLFSFLGNDNGPLKTILLMIVVLRYFLCLYYNLSVITRSIALITPLFSFVSVTMSHRFFTSSVAFPIAIANPAY